MNLKQILKLFKNDRTPTALQLSKALGSYNIDYKAISALKHELADRGYRLTEFTVEKPPAAKGAEFYASNTIKYRLHKFTRDDCWPCGILKDDLSRCFQWRECCNGSVDRGSRRCELAEQQEAGEYNRNKFVLCIRI